MKSAPLVLLLALAVIIPLGAASTHAAFAPDKMAKDGMKKDDAMSKDAMNPASMEQAKIDLIRRHFADFVDRKDVTAAERNFAADFIDHNPPGGTKTIAEGMALARRVYQRFPDMRCELRDVLAQGDKVAVRAVWSGHDAKSGQLMEFHGFTLWRFRGDKIVERWATTTDLRPVSHDDPSWVALACPSRACWRRRRSSPLRSRDFLRRPPSPPARQNAGTIHAVWRSEPGSYASCAKRALRLYGRLLK